VATYTFRLAVPLAEGRRFGFEFWRHDTLSIYAAFDVKSGKLIAKPVNRAEPHSSPYQGCRFLRSGFTSQKSNARVFGRGYPHFRIRFCHYTYLYALSGNTQNLTRIATVAAICPVRRSGNQTLLIPPPQAVSAAASTLVPAVAPVAQV
jgi:hypothetical protein